MLVSTKLLILNLVQLTGLQAQSSNTPTRWDGCIHAKSRQTGKWDDTKDLVCCVSDWVLCNPSQQTKRRKIATLCAEVLSATKYLKHLSVGYNDNLSRLWTMECYARGMIAIQTLLNEWLWTLTSTSSKPLLKRKELPTSFQMPGSRLKKCCFIITHATVCAPSCLYNWLQTFHTMLVVQHWSELSASCAQSGRHRVKHLSNKGMMVWALQPASSHLNKSSPQSIGPFPNCTYMQICIYAWQEQAYRCAWFHQPWCATDREHLENSYMNPLGGADTGKFEFAKPDFFLLSISCQQGCWDFWPRLGSLIVSKSRTVDALKFGELHLTTSGCTSNLQPTSWRGKCDSPSYLPTTLTEPTLMHKKLQQNLLHAAWSYKLTHGSTKSIAIHCAATWFYLGCFLHSCTYLLDHRVLVWVRTIIVHVMWSFTDGVQLQSFARAKLQVGCEIAKFSGDPHKRRQNALLECLQMDVAASEAGVCAHHKSLKLSAGQTWCLAKGRVVRLVLPTLSFWQGQTSFSTQLPANLLVCVWHHNVQSLWQLSRESH